MVLKRTIDNSFTDFLYAVVAGAAFQHFTPYQWSWEDAIVLAAIAILADDWVLYHAQASRVPPTARNFAVMLIFDILVLLLWYSMARLGAIGAEGFRWFVLLLSVFYFVIAVQEFVFRSCTRRTVLMYTDFICSLLLIIWWAILLAANNLLQQWVLLITMILLFALRSPAWNRMVFKTDTASQEA
jgi:hypothetical protein